VPNAASGAACAVTIAPEASCVNHGHSVGMGCQRPEITDVANEDRSAGLGHGDDQGVNGRSALRRGAQHAGSASEAWQEFRNLYELPTLWAPD
jgi:hypothetical protein